MQWAINNSKNDIKKLEGIAGVYLYLKKGKPLYIGKAINVRARLLSHWENAKIDRKESLYVNTADSIEIIQTDSEFRAILLESRLIRIHKPRYNVRWQDDKSFLYIKISVRDTYPKITVIRRENNHRSIYFGPFQSQRRVQEILGEIRKIFPFCTQKKSGKTPCFYSKIGLCDPCPNVIKTSEEKRRYRANIRNIIKTLQGDSIDVQKELYKKLKQLSNRGSYEEALILRNKIFRFEQMFSRRLFGRDEAEYFNQSAESIKELKTLLNLYIHNLDALERIECYDVSNLSQKEAAASMVVFTDGQINKGEYKKFKIRRPKNKSDFDMLHEALERRLKNKWPLPNLIVIDGGRPQLRRLDELRLKNKDLRKLPIIGIAKNPDRLIIGEGTYPTIRPKLNNKGFNLLQHIRDEAHRFARKYHLYLRNQKMMI